MDSLSRITDGEIEVMKWAITDLRPKEIALRLNISPKTVEGRIERLKLKTGTKTPYGLVAFFFRNNLIS